MAMQAATASAVWPVCYNHLEKRADFKCFDCKYESVIHLCPQCNIQVHSLDVFRAHRVEQLELKGRERRLSQDVGDIEKLIEVERDLLQNVLTKLKYTEQEEKNTLGQLIELQSSTKKRMAEIKDCETTIEKAFSYLTKMSTMITQCSLPVEGNDNEAAVFKDPPTENTAAAGQPSAPEQGSTDPPCERTSQEPASEEQNGPPKELSLKSFLPDEMKDKEVFPVSVVGSLTRTGCFWIAKIGEAEEEKQKQIQATIRNHYVEIGGFGKPVVAKEGVFCAAYHRKSKETCRARVECITNSGMVRIRFLDLGTIEEVSQSSLCELPTDVVDAPFQALECCLLPNPDAQIPYEAKWCFKDLTFNKVLVASVEGQVTDKKGNVLHHVLLGSCGEIPVCINSQVAKLVEAQKIALEDRPLQPKAEKPETVEVPNVDDACKPDQPLETATASNLSKDMDTESSSCKEEETEVTTGVDKADHPDEDKPALRAEAAEFVPVSPESDSLSKKIPLNNDLEQSSVPGILHLPPVQDTPGGTVPAHALELFNKEVPATQLPPGCVDFATYNHILTKCSLNMICKEDLPRAHFIMVKSDLRRIVEAMKFNVWCSTVYGNRKLNHHFYEASSKERSPVFLLFAGMKSPMFCGMAEMITEVDSQGSCAMLNEPFKFGWKMSGRCDIKWIYASNVHFGDIITYNKSFLKEAEDCSEIPNKLGQVIVKAFDSAGNFQSILQLAMKWHQSYLANQQENEERFDAEPSCSTPELSDGLSASQEDWDQEIEDSLRAAKSSEPGQVVASSVQEAPKDIPCEKETDLPALSDIDAHVSVDETSRNIPYEKEQTVSESEYTHVSLEDTDVSAAASGISEVPAVDASTTLLTDGDSAGHVEEGLPKVVDTDHQDVAVRVPELQQGGDGQEKAQDENPDNFAGYSIEGQRTVEAYVPVSQEMEDSVLREKQASLPISEQAVEAESSALKEGQVCVTSSDQGLEAETSVSKEIDASALSAEQVLEAESSASKEIQASVPIDQEIKSEGSVPEEELQDVYDSHSINLNESDWETSLVDSVSVSDATEYKGAVSEHEEDKDNSKDAQETLNKDNSTSGRTVDMQEEASVDDTHVSAVLKNQHVFHDSSDETVHAASKSKQELSETVHIYQDNDKLEPHTCNSAGVEAIDDKPGGGGEALLNPCSVEDKLCDESETAVTDTGGSTQEDEGHINGKAGAKNEAVLAELSSHEFHESLESDDFEDFPVEIGKEHWIEPQESVSSSGTFWARVVRTNREEVTFVNAMKRMGTHITAKPKHLDPAGIHIYKQCAVKGRDGYWYRALVEKILDKGKREYLWTNTAISVNVVGSKLQAYATRPNGSIDIRLLDLGEIWEVHQKELRVLDDEFYASPPAQAFECSLCYENPNNKKEKSRTSKLIRRNKKIRVLVKDYSHDGTVGVQVLS